MLLKRTEPLKKIDPEKYEKAKSTIILIREFLRMRGITFCNFAYDVESVLKDQQYYYLDSYKQIEERISGPAGEMMSALSL